MKASSGILFSILRFFQFSSAVLVMSLIAYALNSYDFFGSTRANFGLAVGVIGTFYILCVIILVAAIPQVVMVGPYLIMECIMCLLWLCGFIVTAKVFGQHACGSGFVTANYNSAFGSPNQFISSNGRVDSFTRRYSSSSHTTACRAAKTSIAFSGLSFCLFVISCMILGINVVMPIVDNHGGAGMWKTGGYLGTKLHRWSGLALTSPVTLPQQNQYGPTDLEQQEAAGVSGGQGVGGIPDQRTMSSGESAKSESPNADPKYAEPQYATQNPAVQQSTNTAGFT